VKIVVALLVLWAALLIGGWYLAYEPDPEPIEEAPSGQEQAGPHYTDTGPWPTGPDATASPPATQRQIPYGLGGPGGLEQLVLNAFPEDPETAARIVSCESGWDPAARSRTGDTGLFQINDIHRAPGGVAEGLTVDDLKDPNTNIQVARRLYEQSGWQPWTCY